MCLILVSYRRDPQQPLLVLANRDELHARPTLAAGFWPDHPTLLAGRDGEQGGTWLGLALNGRFAAITNLREPDRRNPSAPSRGWLIRDFLLDHRSAEHFLRDEVQPRAAAFNGFNLLFLAQDGLWRYCNRTDRAEQLGPGEYVTGNSVPDEPWAKALDAAKAFQPLLNSSIRADYFALMRRDTPPTTSGPHPDIPIFLRDGHYGTRSTTLLRIDGAGRVDFEEAGFNASAELTGRRRYRFRLRAVATGFPAIP